MSYHESRHENTLEKVIPMLLGGIVLFIVWKLLLEPIFSHKSQAEESHDKAIK